MDSRVKKISYGYKERRETERQDYKKTLQTISPESIVYLDESGIDDNDTYPYGWGIKGQRVHSLKKGNRTKRLSLMSALNGKALQAPFVFEGYCNSEVFQLYIDRILVPTLKPGQTVVMDNASFH